MNVMDIKEGDVLFYFDEDYIDIYIVLSIDHQNSKYVHAKYLHFNHKDSFEWSTSRLTLDLKYYLTTGSMLKYNKGLVNDILENYGFE